MITNININLKLNYNLVQYNINIDHIIRWQYNVAWYRVHQWVNLVLRGLLIQVLVKPPCDLMRTPGNKPATVDRECNTACVLKYPSSLSISKLIFAANKLVLTIAAYYNDSGALDYFMVCRFC